MQNILIRRLIFVLIACVGVWKFIAFSHDVKEDLVWYGNSDQTGWVLFSSLDFNDGKSAKYISHPGVSTSYVYGLGLKLMHKLGMVEIGKSSHLELHDDPMQYFPELYEKGAYVSIVVIFICALFIGLITYNLTDKQWELGLFSFLMTLFSCGFLFHSVMLRNELTSVFYFILSLFVFIYAYFNRVRSSLVKTVAFVMSGLLLGLAYFAKSQVIMTTILFFVFLFWYHFTSRHRNTEFSIKENIGLLVGHLASYLYLEFALDITIPLFWKLVYFLSLAFSLLSFFNIKFDKNKCFELIHLLNKFSLGFTLSIAYTIVRGLKGETRAVEKVLTYTSFWSPGEKSIQARALDKDLSSILARFGYFLQSYFVESFLVLCLVGVVFFIVKKQIKWRNYALALVLIILACYLSSIRSNLTANLGRSVFKYIIYIDVAVIIVVSLIYKDLLLTFSKKHLVHACFWILLVCFGANNYLKVKTDTDWNWTTYSDIVFPERWLFPGAPPYARKVLKEKYKGYYNGHDRVVFGDEMVREGVLKVPGGERHLARVQKLSAEPYLNRIGKIFELDKDDLEKVVNAETRLLNMKIKAFKDGDNYVTIVTKAIDKRKYLYKNILDAQAYEKYTQLVESGRLSVPF